MISLNLLPDVKKDLLKVRRERNLVVSISFITLIACGVILAALGIALGAAVGIGAHNRSSIENNEKTLESAINDKQLNEYLTVQNQLSQIDGLKDNQLVYSRLLGYLTSLNPASPNNATIRSVGVTDGSSSNSSATVSLSSGEVQMTIEGKVENFSALDVYKNTLLNAELQYEVETDETSSNSDSNSSSSDDESTTSTSKDALSEQLFTTVEVQQSTLSTSQGESSVSFTIMVVFNANAFSNNIVNPKVVIEEQTTSDGDRNAPTDASESAEDNETFHTDDSDTDDSNDNSDDSNNGIVKSAKEGNL